MILGNMNLTGAKELTGGNYILPGHYTVKIIKVEAVDTTAGNKQILITFENKDGKTIKHYANLDSNNEMARDWMYTFLKNLGNDMSTFNGNITSALILNKVINITVVRKYNDFKGKYFNKVSKIEKFDKELGVKNEVDLLAVENIKNEQQTQPQKPQSFINSFQNPEVNNFEINDDDLPF